jgi:hypothetical protein
LHTKISIKSKVHMGTSPFTFTLAAWHQQNSDFLLSLEPVIT